MCGRLTQYRGIHDFVAALNMPNALANFVGEVPLERYNVAPTTQVALLHLQGDLLHADMVRWGWRPHWAKDRAAPINARVEKVAHGPFFRAIWRTGQSRPSITGLSGLTKVAQKSSPT